ncbi:unnamed protein product, partial [Prorocentrum cordatum]
AAWPPRAPSPAAARLPPLWPHAAARPGPRGGAMQAQWMQYGAACSMVPVPTVAGMPAGDYGQSLGCCSQAAGCSGGFATAPRQVSASSGCAPAARQWAAGNQVFLAAAVAAADACQRLQQQQQQHASLARAMAQSVDCSPSSGWPTAAMLAAAPAEATSVTAIGALPNCSLYGCAGDAVALGPGYGCGVGFPTPAPSQAPPPPPARPAVPAGLSFGELEARLSRSWESWANTAEA